MRILITGSGSQLTEPLVTAAEPRGHTVEALSHGQLDVCDLTADIAAVDGFDAIINLAAANSVDACETNPTWAYEGNLLGPLRLARAVRDAGAAFVHFSADFVHGGLADPPGYLTKNTQAVPINTYGHSKLMGEEAVAAVTTCWHVMGDR